MNIKPKAKFLNIHPPLFGFKVTAQMLDLPAFPSGHKQEKEATRSMQVEPLVQEAEAQSSMFSLQSAPVQPLTHTQRQLPLLLVQVPPFWQALGCSRHSSTSSVQNCPFGGRRRSARLGLLYLKGEVTLTIHQTFFTLLSIDPQHGSSLEL